MTQTVWMFSGQGSQYVNMGRDLYEADDVFRSRLELCDDVWCCLRGHGFVDQIYPEAGQKSVPLVKSEITTPALFAVQYAAAEALMARGLRPDCIVGYSLGEFVAKTVSGSIRPEAMLTVLSHLVAALASKIGQDEGGMVAILEAPQIFDARPDMFQGLALAGINSAQNFVVSGTVARLEVLEKTLRKERIVFQRLDVEYAYHASDVDRARTEFLRQPEPRCASERIDIVSASGTCASGLAALWDAVRNPVDFAAAIMSLSSHGSVAALDLGPTGTLASAARATLGADRVQALMSPFAGHKADLQRIANFHGPPDVAAATKINSDPARARTPNLRTARDQ